MEQSRCHECERIGDKYEAAHFQPSYRSPATASQIKIGSWDGVGVLLFYISLTTVKFDSRLARYANCQYKVDRVVESVLPGVKYRTVSRNGYAAGGGLFNE